MLPLALGLMFVGGAGKGDVPITYLELPDAMEGPDSCQRFDSCGYNGRCRCISGSPYVPRFL